MQTISKSYSFGSNPSVSSVNRCVMSAWKLIRYGTDENSMQLDTETRMPKLATPDNVLIKIKAASLNPLDLRMKEGYGRTIIDVMRKCDQRTVLCATNSLPLILGRDCSGVVVDIGQNVKNFRPGDEVWCSVGAERPGCFAQYTVAPARLVSRKPTHLSFTEAASIPYVACTVWSALCTVARLHNRNDGRGLSVLVHGGSGGIGTFAIQLSKVYNAKVTATCSADAFDLVKSLGAQNVVDYSDAQAYDLLTSYGPYDIILKCVNTELSRRSINLLGLWRGSMNVDICNPLLGNADQLGLVGGLTKSALEFSSQFVQHALDGRLSVWAYVYPSGSVLDTITPFIEHNQIKPVVSKTYKFSDVPLALEALAYGKIRGKLVVEVE